VGIGGNEMFLGQYGESDESDVSLIDPIRLMRVTSIDRQTGQMAIEVRFSDFDFMEKGTVWFTSSFIFRLVDLDEESQIRYLKNYLNFLESRQVAKAMAAGIQPATSSDLNFIKKP
jgi:hypothetical protein